MKHKTVLICYVAEWCQPCKVVKQHINNLMEYYSSNYIPVSIIILDVERNKEEAVKHNIKAVPSFVIEMEGNVVSKHVGQCSMEVLGRLVSPYIVYD